MYQMHCLSTLWILLHHLVVVVVAAAVVVLVVAQARQLTFSSFIRAISLFRFK